MSEWSWMIPTADKSQWAGLPFVASDDTPLIGVYCEGRPLRDGGHSHAGETWLVGSLSVDADLHEARGSVHWILRSEYPTGDHKLISLNRQRRRDVDRVDRSQSTTQVLVDDVPLRDHRDVVAADPAKIRSDYVLACPVCGQHQKWRSERIQESATALWALGIREISLALLTGFVARASRQR